MASEPILAVQENIDDQIIEFCKTCEGLTEAQVVRDIARIVCYNDIAFLVGRMVREDRRDHSAELQKSVNKLIDKKVRRNREISSNLRGRVDALTRSERRRRLEEPDEHVDPNSHKGFNSLAYLHGTRPDRADVDRLIQRVLLPLLFD